MTDTSITTPIVSTSTLTLDAWNHEIEIAGGPCMPAAKLERMLDMAPQTFRESSIYHYWRGIADAHQVHLHFGGVAA